MRSSTGCEKGQASYPAWPWRRSPEQGPWASDSIEVLAHVANHEEHATDDERPQP